MGVGVRAHEVKHRRHQDGRCAAEGGDGASSLAEAYLFGDVLESVVARVPAPDLAAAARVSREWLRAVRAALRRRPRRLPWLVVHLQGCRGARRSAAAYDPNSGAWLTVPAVTRHATPSHVRLVRGARGDRVCALSLSGLAVAGDPLGTAACVDLDAPGVWRVDPVFAAVGDRVVALGGACRLALEEDEDFAAVEVHEGGGWTACEPMPDALRDSAAASWLSAAATEQRVYLVERTTGWASWFDPASRQWGPTRRLGLDAAVSNWGVAPGRAGADERLVLFGAKRADKEAECTVAIQAWEVDGDTLEPIPSASNDAMPSELSEKLFPRDDEDEEEDDGWGDTTLSIGVCGNSAGGYVYNAAEPANGAVLYELREGKAAASGGAAAVARWEWVPCAPAVRAEPLGRAILGCSPVGLDELALGVGSAGPRACTAAH
ncbi:hypothetical protein EJB05_55755, partial [Eragrostis curvula]